MVRWWSIFQSKELASIFEGLHGLSLRSFLILGIGWNRLLSANVFHSGPVPVPDLGVGPDDVAAFLKLVSLSISAMERHAGAATLTKATGYRWNPLRKAPVVQLKQGRRDVFTRPFEHLFAQRITSGVYHDIVSDSRAANMIGDEFEKYTADLLAATFPQLAVERSFRYGTKKEPKETPDVIVHLDGRVLGSFECKATKATLEVESADDPTERVTRAIDEIGKGVFQLCRFENDVVRAEKGLEHFRCDEESVWAVITLDNWWLIGPFLRTNYSRRPGSKRREYHWFHSVSANGA